MKLLVLGDSHARVFGIPFFKNKIPELDIELCSVDGATISGLSNPNSKTNTINTFLEALESTSADKVLILLGEVDLGFVLWYRAQKYDEDIMKMMDSTLDNYSNLLVNCEAKFGKENIICLSSPLPTIPDNDPEYGEVANARKSIKATQLERTRLTLTFNNRLKKICESNGYSFLDLDPFSLGEDGLVCSKLLNKNKTDHHYNKFEYAKLMFHSFIEALSPRSSSGAE